MKEKNRRSKDSDDDLEAGSIPSFRPTIFFDFNALKIQVLNFYRDPKNLSFGGKSLLASTNFFSNFFLDLIFL